MDLLDALSQNEFTDLQLAAIYSGLRTWEEMRGHPDPRIEEKITDLMAVLEDVARYRGINLEELDSGNREGFSH